MCFKDDGIKPVTTHVGVSEVYRWCRRPPACHSVFTRGGPSQRAHTRLALAHSPSPEGQTSEPRPGQPCSGAAAGCQGRSAAALTRQAARRASPLSGGDAVFPALRLILGAQLSEDPR